MDGGPLVLFFFLCHRGETYFSVNWRLVSRQLIGNSVFNSYKIYYLDAENKLLIELNEKRRKMMIHREHQITNEHLETISNPPKKVNNKRS